MRRVKDDKHLDFIRSLPCVLCGDNTSTEAAHIRYGDRRVAKRPTGGGEKSDDCWTVPLCGQHHREQHLGSERAFWQRCTLDPIFIAMSLHRLSGNHEAGMQIIGYWNDHPKA